MSFDHIRRPVQSVVQQTNGPLAIVQDARNYYWIVNRTNGKTIRERFQTVQAAKQEASALMFLHRPKAPKPTWAATAEKGRSADRLLDRWPQKQRRRP